MIDVIEFIEEENYEYSVEYNVVEEHTAELMPVYRCVIDVVEANEFGGEI